MRTFDYRTPRFTVDLPVQVNVENVIHMARCTEIGVGGLRLELSENLPQDAPLEIQIDHREVRFRLPARVIYESLDGKGMQFVLDSEDTRRDVTRLVELICKEKPASD